MIGITQTFSPNKSSVVDEPLLTFFGTIYGSTIIIPTSNVVTVHNKDYFINEGNIFTCIKPFTGFVRVFAVGNVRNNRLDPKGGTAAARFYKNNSEIVSSTSSTSLSNIEFNVGDTCCLKANISSGSTSAIGAVGVVLLF